MSLTFLLEKVESLKLADNWGIERKNGNSVVGHSLTLQSVRCCDNFGLTFNRA